METESPAFIPSTFNLSSTNLLSSPSPHPSTARLYSPRETPITTRARQKPLPPTPVHTEQHQPRPQPVRKPQQSHNPRASVDSLYDILAELDESQLSYLVQELNSTTTQNLAVSQAISAFDSVDPTPSLNSARSNMHAPTMTRQLSKSQKFRLSLQTVFRNASVRSKPQPTTSQADLCCDSQSPSTPTATNINRRKSPAYKRISRPTFNLPAGITVTDLLNLLEAEFLSAANSSSASSSYSHSQLSPLSTTSSSFSPSSSFSSASPHTPAADRRIRRYPSIMDMTLEAERTASGVEGIGLGMLEPRPMTPACATPISASASPSTPGGLERMMFGSGRERTPPPPMVTAQASAGVAPPVVLDGIFEVLEKK